MDDQFLLSPKKGPRIGKCGRLLVALVLLGSVTLLYTYTQQPLHQQPILESLNGHAFTAQVDHLVASDSSVVRTSDVSNKSDRGFLVDTAGCRIPDLPAVSEGLKRYLRPYPDPLCSLKYAPMVGSRKQRGPPLVQSNLTAMWVVREALHHYNVDDLRRLTCCYTPFWRVQDDPVKYKKDADNHARFSEKCIKFDGEVATVDVESIEFVRVECSRKLGAGEKTQVVYRDFHAFVPLKSEVERRCTESSQRPDQLSVLIIGLDSVSRLNMLRQLPKTYQLLTSPPFSAISLVGYNKVGDNTFPNVIPLLTGLSMKELETKWWPNKNLKFDECPFIWKDFAARGFRTGYGEDESNFSIFNYKKNGFVEKPTDYYVRPFIYEALKQQGYWGEGPFKLCTGPRQSFENFLNFVKKFSSRFATERSFGFFWSSMVSHQDMNMPHIGDVLLAGTLEELRTCGALERSVLVLMSDHGMRFGKFRETNQGRLEERLPFVLLSFPEWFRRRFPEAVANLQLNARNRLTTPFDVHETLRDLLQPAARLASDVLRARVRDVTSRATSAAGNTTGEGGGGGVPAPRGVSLFVPISPLRTCEDAAISPHWCTCQVSSTVSTTLPIVTAAAAFVLSELNKLLHNVPSCEVLHLGSIKSAELTRPLEEATSTKGAGLKDYVVVLETQPGGAVFEATVRKLPAAKFNLTGPVSRLNAYGDQSHCVADYNLKLYCYCREQVL